MAVEGAEGMVNGATEGLELKDAALILEISWWESPQKVRFSEQPMLHFLPWRNLSHSTIHRGFRARRCTNHRRESELPLRTGLC